MKTSWPRFGPDRAYAHRYLTQWTLSLLAYTVLSLFLLILNLVIIKLGWGQSVFLMAA